MCVRGVHTNTCGAGVGVGAPVWPIERLRFPLATLCRWSAVVRYHPPRVRFSCLHSGKSGNVGQTTLPFGRGGGIGWWTQKRFYHNTAPHVYNPARACGCDPCACAFSSSVRACARCRKCARACVRVSVVLTPGTSGGVCVRARPELWCFCFGRGGASSSSYHHHHHRHQQQNQRRRSLVAWWRNNNVIERIVGEENRKKKRSHSRAPAQSSSSSRAPRTVVHIT